MARTDFQDGDASNPLAIVDAADMNQIGTELNAATAADASLDARVDALEAASHIPSDASVTFAKLAAALVVDATETIATNHNNTTVPTTQAVKDYTDAAVAGVGGGGTTPSDGSVTFAKLAGALVVDSGETITGNNNDTTVPTSKAVKSLVDSAVTGVGGAVDITNWINVCNPSIGGGADRTGATFSDAAFEAAYSAMVASATNLNSVNTRVQRRIIIPPGTYKLQNEGALQKNLGTGSRRHGPTWEGGGWENTQIHFHPASADKFLCKNLDGGGHGDLYCTYEGLSFYSDVASASFLQSDSDGGAQSTGFKDCRWDGTWKYGMQLTGSDTNSEWRFNRCKINGNWNTFLYVPASDTSDQFLNFDFWGTDFEATTGSFIDMAKGGNINIEGGSWIHNGNGTAVQRFLALRGTGHAWGVCRVTVKGVRVEHRHLLSQLILCEWDFGNVEFIGIDSETDWPQLSDPTQLVQAEFGGGNGQYPSIKFHGGSVLGKHKYHYQGNSWNQRHSIEYDGVRFFTDKNFPYNQKAHDSFIFTNDDSTPNQASKPPIRVVGRSKGANADVNEIFDTTLNWETAMNNEAPTRTVEVRGTTKRLSGASQTVYLPLNTRVVGFRVKKRSGGSDANPRSYTLTDGNGATIATVNTGVNWSTAWSVNAGELDYELTTAQQCKLTVSTTNTEGSNIGSVKVDFVAG